MCSGLQRSPDRPDYDETSGSSASSIATETATATIRPKPVSQRLKAIVQGAIQRQPFDAGQRLDLPQTEV